MDRKRIIYLIKSYATFKVKPRIIKYYYRAPAASKLMWYEYLSADECSVNMERYQITADEKLSSLLNVDVGHIFTQDSLPNYIHLLQIFK